MVNPANAEFQRITEKEDSATLILSAQDEGHELKGTIEFIKEGDAEQLGGKIGCSIRRGYHPFSCNFSL